MDLAQSPGDTDSKAQKVTNVHGLTEQPDQWLAAGVIEQQHGLTAFADQLQRPRCPCAIQLILQAIFMPEVMEAGWRLLFRGGQHGEDGGAPAFGARTPPSAEDTFAVLPVDLGAAIPISVKSREPVQLRYSRCQLARRHLAERERKRPSASAGQAASKVVPDHANSTVAATTAAVEPSLRSCFRAVGKERVDPMVVAMMAPLPSMPLNEARDKATARIQRD